MSFALPRSRDTRRVLSRLVGLPCRSVPVGLKRWLINTEIPRGEQLTKTGSTQNHSAAVSTVLASPPTPREQSDHNHRNESGHDSEPRPARSRRLGHTVIRTRSGGPRPRRRPFARLIRSSRLCRLVRHRSVRTHPSRPGDLCVGIDRIARLDLPLGSPNRIARVPDPDRFVEYRSSPLWSNSQSPTPDCIPPTADSTLQSAFRDR